ncbi:hypothetical protein HJC23_013426 [Cyclotella cryptica]|uniref:Uncharacterized protein n=1 Tax=Cyclotella cryptica TaxID=29204 RepID=A0ABD3P7P6_9STRA
MDISLLLEPQAKHQRMYRGDSMYDEHSLAEIKTIPCPYCNRQFAPKAYVSHIRKPKCLNPGKSSLNDSAKKRIFNNRHLSQDENEMVNSKGESKISMGRRDGKEGRSRKWKDDSNKLRAAMNQRTKLKHNK